MATAPNLTSAADDAPIMSPTPAEQRAAFLTTMCPTIPDGMWSLIWTLDTTTETKVTYWANSTDQMIAAADRAGDATNVYFSIGLSPSNFGPDRRCKQDEVAGICGLWADIDVRGPVHDNGAESIEEAMALVERFGLRPTIVECSGTGVQAFWLFNEPWVFESKEDRWQAMLLIARFSRTLETYARAREFSVKGTFNLDRVMRVAGTFNQCKGKCEPRPTYIIQNNSTLRYEADDFTDFLIPDGDDVAEEDESTVDVGGLTYAAAADPPAEKLAKLIEDSPLFAASWAGERTDNPTWDRNHPSEYNLSIVALAADAGWSKQECVDLMIAQRRTFGVDLKLGEATYKKTVGKAFAKIERKEKEKAERAEAARAAVERAIRAARQSGNPSVAFGAAGRLAEMEHGALADAIAKFKELLGSKLNVRELKAAIKEERRAKKKKKKQSHNNLPTIIASGRQMPEITHEVIRSVAEANVPPVMFTRGGAPTRIRVNDDKTLVLQQMSEAAVRGRIARCGNFVVFNKDGEEIAVPPPMEIVRDVIALDLADYTRTHKMPLIPPIEAIVSMPVLRTDWSVVEEEGYDAATRLYYDNSSKLIVPTVPSNPLGDDVEEAKSLIHGAIGEFPHEGDADYANAVATFITPAIRHAINGKTPIALFDAPQAGTGKSLEVDVIGHVLTGDSPPMKPVANNDEEMRKVLTAASIGGPSIIVFDNLAGPLSHSSLALYVTCSIWSDRILGSSVDVHQKPAMIIVTGNNIEVGGDIGRRCYRIRLDAKTARPWRGRTFTHPNLLQWVSENRGRLIWAILTLCRAWHVAGRPLPTKSPTLGSFEPWCQTVGGILEFAGIPGFLANVEELYEQADDNACEWEQFLTVWHARYGEAQVSTTEIMNDLQSVDAADLRDALPDGLGGFVKFQPPRYMEPGKFIVSEAGRFKIKLGKQLKQRIGRRYGTQPLYIERNSDLHNKTALWTVKSAGSAGSAGGVSAQCGARVVVSQTHDEVDIETTVNNLVGQIGRNTPATPRTPRNHVPDYEDLEREALVVEGM